MIFLVGNGMTLSFEAFVVRFCLTRSLWWIFSNSRFTKQGSFPVLSLEYNSFHKLGKRRRRQFQIRPEADDFHEVLSELVTVSVASARTINKLQHHTPCLGKVRLMFRRLRTKARFITFSSPVFRENCSTENCQLVKRNLRTVREYLLELNSILQTLWH